MEIQESDTPEPKSPRDFRPWETLDFLPAGCFLYHQAASQIADTLEWSDYKLEALLGDMAEAINAKALPTVSRKTGLRVPKDREPEFLGVVTVDDVNAWLTARGAPYRWTPTEQAPAPANGNTKGKDSPSWIDDARAIAWTIINRQRALDLFPSQIIIAEEIAKKWRTEGRHTFTGEYIKRHALKGITSDLSKLKQMQIGQGK
jgi:hypothetical protein